MENKYFDMEAPWSSGVRRGLAIWAMVLRRGFKSWLHLKNWMEKKDHLMAEKNN